MPHGGSKVKGGSNRKGKPSPGARVSVGPSEERTGDSNGVTTNVTVLFKGDRPSLSASSGALTNAVPTNKILLSTSDFRSLRVQAGSVVVVTSTLSSSASSPLRPLPSSTPTMPGITLCLQLWPCSSLQKGTALLNLLWKPLFPDGVGSSISSSAARHVSVSKDISSVRVLAATEILLAAEASEHCHGGGSIPTRELNSVEFKNYLSLYIQGLLLMPGILFSIPWKAMKVTMRVVSLSPTSDHQGEGATDEILYVHSISLQTSVRTTTAKSLSRFGEERAPDRTHPSSSTFSSSSMAFLLQKEFRFGGYTTQILSALSTARLALGMSCDELTADLITHPPRGILIAGPHGTGKTRFMREIVGIF